MHPASRLVVDLVLLLGVAPALAAQGSVQVVDWNVTHGAPFTGVQAAVDAAVEGDTLLIAEGTYSAFTIDGKSLFLTADEGALVSVDGLAVRNLAAGQSVAIADLIVDGANVIMHPQPFVLVEDCVGSVSFQGCTMSALNGDFFLASAPQAMVHVEDCDGVSFTACTIHGRVVTSLVSQLVGASAPALVATRSNVSSHASELLGADGIDGFDDGTLLLPATPGESAVRLDGGSFLATGSVLSGGEGGDANLQFFGGCIAAATGGAAVEIVGGAPTVRLQDSALAGGGGGGDPFVTGCAPASAGPTLDPPTAPTITLPGLAHPFEMTTVVRESGTLTATLHGSPGEFAWAVLGLDPGWALVPDVGGVLLVGPPFVNVLPVGPVPASGTVTLTVAAPSVGPGFDVVHAMTQPLFVDGGDLRIGDAALTLVLDDAF